MRYIKLFESFEDDLLEFTEVHLAYLVDDGFEINQHNTHNYFSDRKKISIVKRSGFTWEEIVDRFSPYIYMLNKEYNILEVVFNQSGGRQHQSFLSLSERTSFFPAADDTRKDIEELVSGESDQYLTNKFYWMITIIVKNKE